MNEKKISLGDVLALFASAGRVLIIGHTSPDGDAVGSCTALAYIAEALGCRADCTFPDKPQERLHHLMRESDVSFELDTDTIADTYDAIVTVDTASRVQLGHLSYLAETGMIDMMIDHHGTGEAYAPAFIDPSAAAAGEIIFRLYKAARRDYGIMPDPRAARAMYAAMLCDTGSFKYSNTTPATLTAAAGLMGEINSAVDGGLTTDEMCRVLFGTRTLSDLKAQALSISKLEVSPGGELGIVMLTAKDIRASGLDESDFGMAVEVPRSLEGVKVALSIKQSLEDETLFKVSSRSNSEVNVAEICAAFGGGGHVKAAGCRINAKSPAEAKRILTEAFSPRVGE